MPKPEYKQGMTVSEITAIGKAGAARAAKQVRLKFGESKPLAEFARVNLGNPNFDDKDAEPKNPFRLRIKDMTSMWVGHKKAGYVEEAQCVLAELSYWIYRSQAKGFLTKALVDAPLRRIVVAVFDPQKVESADGHSNGNGHNGHEKEKLATYQTIASTAGEKILA